MNFVTLNYGDFEPFLDHPKTTFFETEKKIEIRPGVAGIVKNGPESIWKGSPITFDTFL